MKLTNENEQEEAKFGNNLDKVIDITRKNNETLNIQGEGIRNIDKKNEKIYNEISRADRTIRQMEHSQFLKKLLLRGIAVLLTALNVLMFFRMLIG
mmetsp:Transcript_8550/g.13203  ORF Transcript_8550/g.13203 Transcript_8550/m.13203 type:complete len:96 (+) Transcript_8550:295-582(+)